MFIKPDGTFTQGNVYINQGEEVCIVVLVSFFFFYREKNRKAEFFLSLVLYQPRKKMMQPILDQKIAL